MTELTSVPRVPKPLAPARLRRLQALRLLPEATRRRLLILLAKVVA